MTNKLAGTGEIAFSLKLSPMDEAGIAAAKDVMNKKLGE